MDPTRRYWLPRLAIAPALLVTLGFMSSNANGQASDRFAVLVPAYTSQTDARSKFGRDLAKALGKLINELPRYRLLDNGTLKDGLKKYGLKEEDLSAPPQCLKARQLAIQINVNLVMCGTFEGTKDNYTVATQIFAPAESEVYDLKSFQAGDPEVAAQQIAEEFQGWVEGLLFASYCAQYVASENWPSAIENCTKAVQSSPSKGRIYMLSYAQWQSGNRESAYDGFKRVLTMDEQHLETLKALGILATEMGRPEEGMDYFRRYVDLNPGDRLVRLTVASDAAKAGNYEAALAIIEDGLTGDDANNLDLLEAAGVYAMNGANQKIAANDGAMTPEAEPLFNKSLEYLDRVYAEKGAEMDVSLIRNIIQADRLLERDSAAVAFAATVTANPAFASDPGLWSVYADVLNKAGRQDEAFAALDKAASLDPDYEVNARRASWLLDAGDLAGATAAIRTGVDKGEIRPDQADVLGQKLAVTAYQRKAQAGQHQAALRDYATAKTFVSSDLGKAYVAFFEGYSKLQIAIQREEPETLETARATLPLFREVISLMQAAAAIPQNLQANRRELIAAAQQYVDIQQAIIKRGR
ncbi:MAG: hypothetical protein PVH00_10295 [Gemmatimonadota bacterium]